MDNYGQGSGYQFYQAPHHHPSTEMNPVEAETPKIVIQVKRPESTEDSCLGKRPYSEAFDAPQPGATKIRLNFNINAQPNSSSPDYSSSGSYSSEPLSPDLQKESPEDDLVEEEEVKDTVEPPLQLLVEPLPSDT
jgi:hypothetical protein